MVTEEASGSEVSASHELAGQSSSNNESPDVGETSEEIDDLEIHDAQRDEPPSDEALDAKLAPMRITKINVKSVLADLQPIQKKNDLKDAKKIVSMLLKRKCGANVDNRTQDEQIPSVSRQDSGLRRSSERFQQLFIRYIPESDFILEIYFEDRKTHSAVTKTLMKLLTAHSYETLLRKQEISKTFIFIFYRNVEQNDKSFKPEIFVLTTGFAWSLVAKYADRDFPKFVERRTLQFPLDNVQVKKDKGPVFKETKIARPGEEIIFSVWDFLDKLVGNRTRKLKEKSSLYALSAFQNYDKIPKIDICDNALKIRLNVTLRQLEPILRHFSVICRQEQTFQADINGQATTILEEDGKKFRIHDFLSAVESKLCSQLDTVLHRELEQSMDGSNSVIVLTHKSYRWNSTGTVELRAFRYAHADSQNEKGIPTKKRTKIKTWSELPFLDEVMEALRENSCAKYKKQWLDEAYIKFGNTSEPLKKFIYDRFSIQGVGTYIYHYGDWLQMNAEYLYHIEREFVETLAEYKDEGHYLLPWKYEAKKEKNKKGEYKIHNTNLTPLLPKWKYHFQKICPGESFNKVEENINNLISKQTLMIDFGELKTKTSTEKAAYLYVLLECHLNEDDYNAAHTLLHMIQKDPMTLTCDKKKPHNIELCDILIDKKESKQTYMVHVKAKLRAMPMRGVCSQVRNAAEHMFRERQLTDGTGMIDKYWKVLTKEAKTSNTHENVVMNSLKTLGEEDFKNLFHKERNIVFVLACRGDTDFMDVVERDLEVNLAPALDSKFANSTNIIHKLKKEGYMTQDGSLTNKFILDGKANEKDFVNEIKRWDEIKTAKEAKDVRDIFISSLSKSKSTVAKMEIIRLAKDFEKYSGRGKKIQLKICSISHDYQN